MMSTEEQKDFGHLLFRMQNGLCLTIGPFGELNYEMATDVSIVRLFIFHWFEFTFESIYFS